MDETGYMYLHEPFRALRISETYLAEEMRAQLAILRKRRALYTPAVFIEKRQPVHALLAAPQILRMLDDLEMVEDFHEDFIKRDIPFAL